MFFLSIKKRNIIIAVFIVFLMSVFFALPTLVASAKTYPYTIVIDAGHGGVDGGSVSPFSGVDENHLNLKYALTLKEFLEELGIRVVLTRSNLNGLYSIFAENRKKDDMEKRRQIIENAKANLVVSIHMNSYPLRSSRGAQVFFKEEDEKSKNLAQNVQTVFSKNLEHAKSEALKGDYYILNCSSTTSIIVECGFLTNKEEEKLLQMEDYMKKLCMCIVYGIVLSL